MEKDHNDDDDMYRIFIIQKQHEVEKRMNFYKTETIIKQINILLFL